MSEGSDSSASWINPAFAGGTASGRIAEMLTRGDALRACVASRCTLGTFLIELPCAATLSALALAGFDFVVLDMEHSGIDFARLQTLIVAGHGAGLAVLVRPWGEDTGLIGKVLDMGAHGIMAPHVDAAERAREIVNQVRFPPLGRRGFSPLTKYDSLQRPFRALGDSCYVVLQIEGREALARAGEIAAVPGIDAVFVGPYDLALSLGVAPGSQPVFDAAGRLADAVAPGVGLGIYIDDPATSGAWAARRFNLQCLSFDGRMLVHGARHVVGMARGVAPDDHEAGPGK